MELWFLNSDEMAWLNTRAYYVVFISYKPLITLFALFNKHVTFLPCFLLCKCSAFWTNLLCLVPSVK